MNMKKYVLFILILLSFCSFSYSETVKIKNIARILGQEIYIEGYGLVVGLKGTGDTLKNYSTSKSISEYLKKMGLEVDPTNFQARNSASVIVSAKINPNLKKGVTFDVNVASIFDARSLEGGFLVRTPLKDSNGNVVAFAQGVIVSPKGSIKTTGIIPSGGLLENDLSQSFVKNNKVALVFEGVSPSVVSKVVNVLKNNFAKISIQVVDSSLVEIEIPEEYQGNELEFLSKVMETEVEIVDEAFVVIDQKSSTVVITGDIKLYPLTISYKGMKIVFSEMTSFLEYGEIYTIPSNNLKDFVDTLSKIGVKAEDLIQILLLMKEAGALKARFIVK